MQKLGMLAAVLAVSVVVAGCASSGPVVPVPPTVKLTEFRSTLITPDAIHFQATVVIKNQMRARLEIDRVDYGAELHDNPLFQESFSELHSMRSRGRQTVRLPFRVAMSDILNQAEDVLAEESLRVTFLGAVFPRGFHAISFEATAVIPAPRIPEISVDGVQGTPLEGEFSVFLKVENRNTFPLVFENVDSFLTLNGKRYDLLRTECFERVDPGAAGRIRLTMRQTRGKGLSMLLNVARNQSTECSIGGSISCATPYGLIRLPLELSGVHAASPSR